MNSSGTKNGLRSPMNGYEPKGGFSKPSVAANTTMKGTAGKAAKVQSPMQPKNPKT